MGRQAILLVLGYSLMFIMTGLMMSNGSVDAFQNAISYSEGSVVRDIAISGANIGANYIFINKPLMNSNPWWTGANGSLNLTNIKLNGGTFTVRCDSVTDMYGLWGRIQMTSTATYNDSTYKVIVLFNPSNFSKFCLYAGKGSANVYFEPTDSVFGPCHIDTVLNYGNPSGGTMTHGAYFGGKTSTKNGVHASTSPAVLPNFVQGRVDGLSIPLQLNSAQLIAKAGAQLRTGGELWLNFKDDSVAWKTSKTGAVTTQAITTIAPNGVIAIDKGTLYVQGEIDAKLTVASLRSSGSTGGTVVIKDNVTYKTDPRVNPLANGMLGIVGYSTVNIDTTGSHNDFTVDASIMSLTDGLQVVNYSTRPRGLLYVLGGWICTNLYATSNGTTAGLPINVTYDPRFAVTAPPWFPGTNSYEILAWYE